LLLQISTREHPCPGFEDFLLKKYYLKTYGCQMNVHDSEKIAGIFSENGLSSTGHAEDADVIVLNTCSIREKAEQKFLSELGRLRKAKENNPNMKIAVAGCIAQQQGKALFKRFPYVDFIVGPNNIDKFHTWIDKKNTVTAIDDNPEYHNKILPLQRAGGVRAWVSIMYGCENFCAYCVVPYTRGKERSRPLQDICDEIITLDEKGYKEVTLLGQNVNSYGRNLEGAVDFPGLLRKIHSIDGIKRIRFVTSHPRDLSENLIMAMEELPEVCEHLHLPIQSGSDHVLQIMNRGYTFAEYMNRVNRLRKAIPGIAITTDIITGFPGETEEDFQLTMNALSDIEYDGIFAFKYSRRPGTKALEMPDHVEEHIKSERLAQVLQFQESVTYKKNSELEGQVLEILVEGPSSSDPERLTGRTRTNKIVNYCGESEDRDTFVNIRILKAGHHSLFGEKV
jgi:tRNA-2-methylthio-N6-dimethylallyladenosine synthase